jgi:hypothetical protein
MLGLAVTARVFNRPIDPPGRRKGIDGTWTGPLWFQGRVSGCVTPEKREIL